MKSREESRVADAAGPRLFRAKTVHPPQRAGFGLDPSALFSAQAGENRAPGARLGRFFGAGAKKSPGEAFLGRGWRCPYSASAHTYIWALPKTNVATQPIRSMHHTPE